MKLRTIYKKMEGAQNVMGVSYGRWAFSYKGQWHEVKSYGIRKQLDKLNS